MTERQTPVTGKLWISIQVLIGIALAGSTWAFLASDGCRSCGEASASPGGSILAALGITYYAALLGSSLLVGPIRIVYGGITVAAGVHVSLLALLLSRGTFCPPCILTGGAALSAVILSFFQDGRNLTRAMWTLPVTAIAWNVVAIYLLGVAPPPLQGDGKALKAAATYENLKGAEPNPEHVRITVYSNPECHYCQELKTEIMPRLEAQFGGTLAVDWRHAEEFPGMPTPTIFVRGPGRPGGIPFQTMFPGLPPEEVLRDAILKAQGKDTAHAMLPASR